MPTKKSTKGRKTIMKSKKRQSNIWRKYLCNNKLTIVVFVIGFALVGSYLLLHGFAQSDNRIVPFIDKPERGLAWAGLKANANSALCGGQLLEMIDQTGNAIGCTHGPDPAPEGIDARKASEPEVTVADASTGVGTTYGNGSILCDGDGVNGNRIQLIYAHASDKPDRYDNYASSFQVWAANVDSEFVDSASETGGVRHVRYVTDANCNAIVARVTLSPTGDDNFSATASEVRSQGYSRSDRKYLIWTDATVYCGISQLYSDDSAASTNRNNIGPGYARVDTGCWGLTRSTEAHELMHTLGGVQYTAPHTTGGGHCTDEYDRMCYDDRTTTDTRQFTMTYPCASSSHEALFDCNHDDYYSTSPLAGSYLTTHWNTANSSFLISSGNGSGTTTPPADTTAPLITISSPKNGASLKGKSVTITASATDDVGVTKIEIYIDGSLQSTSLSDSISTRWDLRKASKGTHLITVKAYDATGNVGQSSVSVTK
jgi:hypothetical protein